jgi:hypothetical protein
MASNLLFAAIHLAAAGVASLSVTTVDGSPAAGESAEEFSERMVAAIDSASLTILLSVGHQTGLLDTMAGLSPATSAAIAEAAGLNERYVREAASAMAADCPTANFRGFTH